MLTPHLAQQALDDLARDLDLVLFRIEREANDDSPWAPEVRRELERIRDRLTQLASTIK